jgi:hypothetical protein
MIVPKIRLVVLVVRHRQLPRVLDLGQARGTCWPVGCVIVATTVGGRSSGNNSEKSCFECAAMADRYQTTLVRATHGSASCGDAHLIVNNAG